MGEAQVHCELVAGDRSTVTDTDDLQNLCVVLFAAFDHGCDEGTCCAVELFGVLVLVRTGDCNGSVLNFNTHERGELSYERSLRTFHRHLIPFSDGNFDACRNGNQLITDT